LELIEDQAGQDQLTGLYTRRAVNFIDRHADAPFFLYLAHTMVHVPLGVSDEFRGRTVQGMFGDVMEEVDWSVGQVMETLDRNGLTEDTLVIFTSDNGPWLNFGNHAGSAGGLREGKGTAFEGGPRVPAIWRWPGRIEPGSVCSQMASTLDVLPTVAAISGAALPRGPIDGVDILSLLDGEDGADPRDNFLFYYDGQLRGIREGRWKRVYEHRTRSYVGVEPGMDGIPGPYASPTVPEALYDLENDVGETMDVAGEHPDIVARLDAMAEEARSALGDGLSGRRGSEVRPPGRRGFARPETIEHLAVGAQVTLYAPPSPSYPGAGAAGLCDGRLGTRDHSDGRWMGWSGTDLEAVLDLGGEREVRRVGVDCLRAQGPWIFPHRTRGRSRPIRTGPCQESGPSPGMAPWHPGGCVAVRGRDRGGRRLTGSVGCPGGTGCGHLLEGRGVGLYFHALSSGANPSFKRSRQRNQDGQGQRGGRTPGG